MLDPETFTNILQQNFAAYLSAPKLAVAVSGGPDSMALLHLLCGWAAEQGKTIHAVTVDHGLRAESAAEAAQVKEFAQKTGAEPYSYKWEGPKPETGIQAAARAARYNLIEKHCRTHEIGAFFTAHHQDDQAETVLFRLAKGSGLDGLNAMSTVTNLSGGVHILRPLLGVPKADLVAYCQAQDIPYAEDPTNEDDAFARPRLRAARAVLEREGFTSERLAGTARRLARAREALDFYGGQVYESHLISKNTKQIVFKLFEGVPEEIVLRILQKAIAELVPDAEYPPRMEKLESLMEDLLAAQPFRKRTLGGVIFERDDKNRQILLSRE